MRLYRITRFNDDSAPLWEKSLAEAKLTAESAGGGDQRRIELFDIKVDIHVLVNLLRRESMEYMNIEPMSTWMLTPRGGIKTIPNGE